MGGRPAVVQPTSAALSARRPLPAGAVRLRGGFWGDRLQLNRQRTLPHGFAQLDRAGNLHNFRLAGGTASGEYRALGLMFEQPYPFLDSDAYKWLEACGWELGRSDDADLRRQADELIGLIQRAQRADGYINTFVQVLAPGREYRDLHWGHELYCIGHLVQAAIAWQRALGDERLLQVALAAVASVESELGAAGREGIDGHPEIEMALVELYRTTGDRSHLELARRFIELRGRGLLGAGRFGAAYWQDHAGVRQATTVAGHVVRQLYLDCGAVDLAGELGDHQLLEAVRRRWHDMLATRSYLTGGLGSRHRDEAFGDPYELPPDQAYTETCAAIASVMLAWRLLLATGDERCAEVIERTMYNGVLPGLSLDATEFFYVNPLQRRTEQVGQEGAAYGNGSAGRSAWYACACCPPNLMRLFASWEQYLASADESGVRLHHYAPLELSTPVPGGMLQLELETGYPWEGQVLLTVRRAPPEPFTLELRVPAWADLAEASLNEEDDVKLERRGGTISERRRWQAGETIRLDFGMRPRLIEPDRRIDAVRGCLALERGPLVYCLETADLPAGQAVEDVELALGPAPVEVGREDILPGMIGLSAAARLHQRPAGEWPYEPMSGATPVSHAAAHGAGAPSKGGAAEDSRIGLIPYFAWANRAVRAMRVWLPVSWPR